MLGYLNPLSPATYRGGRLWAWFAAFMLGIVLAAPAVAQQTVPRLERRVTDLTSTLTAAQADALESRLAAFEQKKGSQIAVLIVPTTQPETIEQYGIRVAEAWKLGRKGVDDGAILLMAKGDRTVRIEVGRGLEGVLPDVTAKRIIEDRIIPRFRAGDFAGGVDTGVSAMVDIVSGEALPAPRPTGGAGPDTEGNWLFVLVIAFILSSTVGAILRSIFGRFLGAVFSGAGVGALAWVFAASMGLALIAGAIVFFLVLFGGIGSGGGWHSGGRWGGGGWSGGGGGFGSGGGFGGGGGDFGGGGASGRW